MISKDLSVDYGLMLNNSVSSLGKWHNKHCFLRCYESYYENGNYYFWSVSIYKVGRNKDFLRYREIELFLNEKLYDQ